jgi:hypothetical protein
MALIQKETEIIKEILIWFDKYLGPVGKKQEYKFLDLWTDADPGIAEVEDAKKRFAGFRNSINQ